MAKILVYGGETKYRYELYKNLANKEGYDFIICLAPGWQKLKQFDFRKIDRIKAVLEYKKLFGNFHYYKSFYKSGYDIYIIAGPFTLNSWLILIRKCFTDIKVVSWSHGIYGRESRIRNMIKKIYYRLCDSNLVYGERGRSLLIENGIAPNKVEWVGNCLDISDAQRIIDKLNPSNLLRDITGNTYPNLIFVGRVTQVKKLEQVIEAMEILENLGKPMNFFVIGGMVDGLKFENRLSKSVVRNRIFILGEEHDIIKVGKYVYNADLLVSPGNVGLTAITSLLCGTPILTHSSFEFQVPEYECILPGITGDYFQMNNVKDLAKKIDVWITSVSSDSVRDEIRSNCRKEYFYKWNPEVESKRIINHINQLLK